MSILRTKTDPRWAAVATGDLDRTLSDQQTTAIVAFLRTLTGTYRGRPVTEAMP